ncbi:MAG: hypothetical protein ACHQCG_01170 [Solirubrobacterales bacterium]
MTIRSLLPVALAALLSAATTPVGAQASVGGATLATPDTDTDPTIRHELEIARAKRLPLEPLLTKVREGRLKRASTPRIRAAVAALAIRLDSSLAIIGPDATVEELTACADALAAGADASELRTVAGAATTRPISAPLGALAQLVASGVPPKRATQMIVELLRKRVGAPQVLAFGNLVEADAASGVPAEEAAVFRLHAIGTGADAALSTATPATGINLMSRPAPVTGKPRRRP